MEDVLEVYKRPYDQNIPVVCMDEQPTQLIKETRTPIAMGPGHAQRVNYGKYLAMLRDIAENTDSAGFTDRTSGVCANVLSVLLSVRSCASCGRIQGAWAVPEQRH